VGTLIMIGIFALLILSIFLIVKYCKKTLKLVLLPIIGLLILYFTVLYIDMSRVNSLHRPIFVWEPTADVGTNEVSFQGIGYKVIVEYFEDGRIEAVTMYMFDKVIAAAIT
jgi:energy-coupling factor transporter transmembrane protein EcfT